MKKLLKTKKNILLPGIAALLLLAATFWYGGSAPGLQGWTAEPKAVAALPSAADAEISIKEIDMPPATEAAITTPADEATTSTAEAPPETNASAPEITSTMPVTTAPSAPPGANSGNPLTAEEKIALAKEMAGGRSSQDVLPGDADYSALQGMGINSSTGKDKYLTDPVPEGKPVPMEPQEAAISDMALTCTLSVRCDAILDNMEWLNSEKWELVPDDGVIFATATVTFYEGESVFNILQREMKRAKIHMEFMNTPMYNSAYIEGINNLYEFDVGELSGWMYKVNGWFPNYGCSRYRLREGDIVEWVYTCNLGVDVGGYYAVGG